MSPADAATALPPTAPEHLPDDPATLKRMILELLLSLQEHARANEALRHRLDQLLRRLYGPRGERFNPDQPLLFAEADANSDTAAAGPPEGAAAAKPKRRGKPHGRRRLPEHLPRESRHHELPEAARVCARCGSTAGRVVGGVLVGLICRPWRALGLLAEGWMRAREGPGGGGCKAGRARGGGVDAARR